MILDRDDAKWTAQKLDDPEFERKQDAVRLYAAYDLEKNGWNEAMKRTVLVTHNFDVMSGEAGNGFELVALVKALDKMQGSYSATRWKSASTTGWRPSTWRRTTLKTSTPE